MRRPECQPWIEITDRDAIGEFVSEDERRFLRTHEATCRSCAEEAAVWDSFDGGALTPVLDAQALEQILLEVRRLPPEEDRPLPKRRWAPAPRRLAAGVAAACAMAAALVLVIRRSAPPSAVARVDHGSAVPTTVSDPPAVSQPAPLATRSEPRLVVGSAPTCRLVAPGVTACLAAGSEVTTARLEPPRRLLDLVRGRVVVSLTPQPAGQSFGVATTAGTVTAVGTVFSVEITATGETVARVERGVVAVQNAGSSSEQRLYAGEQLRLGDSHAAAPLPAQDRKRDLSLLASREDRAPRGEKMADPGEREDRALARSEPSRGEPARGELPRGEKVAEPPRVAIESNPNVNSAAPAAAPTPVAGQPAPRATAEAAPAQPSARQLLGRARTLRSQGSFREAAEVYRAAHAANPQSAEGLAALVSLGGLLLSELNEPAAALSAFDTYLSGRKGDLAQEAEFGRIRALRALGRFDAEKTAIQAFLASHPDGPEAQVLRRRLEAMSTK